VTKIKKKRFLHLRVKQLATRLMGQCSVDVPQRRLYKPEHLARRQISMSRQLLSP